MNTTHHFRIVGQVQTIRNTSTGVSCPQAAKLGFVVQRHYTTIRPEVYEDEFYSVSRNGKRIIELQTIEEVKSFLCGVEYQISLTSCFA